MRTFTRALVFDMDGTIADFYGVPNWLTYLEQEDVFPYVNAEPLYDMAELCDILRNLQTKGWTIVVTTWLAKDATKEYNKRTAYAKKEWLKRFDFPADEIHCLKYGTTKADATRKKGGFQILVDDNKKVRDGWTLGTTVNATYDIMNFLKALL